MKATSLLIAASITAMGCASPRLAQNNDMPPVRVEADENGAAVMMDVSQGGLVNWIKANPWKVAGTVAAGYAAYRVGDHNDWFRGGSDGDRRATQTYVEINGDNNRVVIVSDQGTGSASGDPNTGSGGQVR